MRNVISVKDVTNSLLRKIEMKILMFFNGSVAVPTVAHFIELYKEYCYRDKDFSKNATASSLKDQFESMLLFYQDVSLECEYCYLIATKSIQNSFMIFILINITYLKNEYVCIKI